MIHDITLVLCGIVSGFGFGAALRFHAQRVQIAHLTAEVARCRAMHRDAVDALSKRIYELTDEREERAR